MITAERELLPCPFCGSAPKYADDGYTGCTNYHCPAFPCLTKESRWNERWQARAGEVQTAVREPTEAMLIAARDWSDKKYGMPIGNDAAKGCWQAMLDAAPEGRLDTGAATPSFGADKAVSPNGE